MATNDNETALENMYRSQLWADLNFGEVVFIYAGAWTNLLIARKSTDQIIKGRALRLAHKGFRVASTQFFRPNLMYGAWAGVGYVEAEMGRFARAREIFSRLYQVMDETENNKAKSVLERELRVLDALTGNIKTRNFTKRVDKDEAQILRVELISLLRESKEDESFPEGAAERFNKLVRAGRLDQSLFEEVMTYSLELSSLNIGQWAELASAEYRLQNGDFTRAVRKFNAFFNRGNIPRGLDLRRYRYRWAVSAYKARYYQTSAGILERLLRNRDLSEETLRKSSKLLYLAYLKQEVEKASLSNRKFLHKAARRFIETNPEDAAINGAKLVLAQTNPNHNESIRMLEGLLEEGPDRSSFLRALFEVKARRFSNKISLGQMQESKRFARDGLDSYQQMDDVDRERPLNRAINLQMRAVVLENSENILSEIKEIEMTGPLGRDVERTLFWTRLLVAGRYDYREAKVYFDGLMARVIPSWKVDILYLLLSSMKNKKLVVHLAERLTRLPSLESSMAKRTRIIWIQGLIDLGNSEEAYEQARFFLTDYPTSGDAWRLLGRSAEAEGQLFEADKAWGMVTKKTSPRQKIWWEGMINRTRIRAARRPDQACALLKRLIQSDKHIPRDYLKNFRYLKNNLDCAFLGRS